MTDTPTRSEGAVTQYGFTWGAATVTRMAEFEGQTCTEFRTDTHKLNVYVSPKGRSVRVWLDGRELK